MEKINKLALIIAIGLLALSPPVFSEYRCATEALIAEALGWVQTHENRCGGYYLEPPTATCENLLHPDTISISSNEVVYALHGQSEVTGKVTIRHNGQEITADKAYFYRNPQTGKFKSVDLTGNINMRELNTLLVADRGHLDFETKQSSLLQTLYRTIIYSNGENRPHEITTLAEKEHHVTQLSAWGQASAFNQEHPKIYLLDNTSYTTCPPGQICWIVRASHLTLNKETGRGEAYNTRVYVHHIPVFYAPYLNFPIDSRRKTGILWPIPGSNSLSGYSLAVPFYWNMAPNYDMAITPISFSKRGVQLGDLFRYLTPGSSGFIRAAILPNDRAFEQFQDNAPAKYASTDPVTQAQLRRLEQASPTRKSISWKNDTIFNEHWFGGVDYSYVSDDYYLRDFHSGINEYDKNQLLQQANIIYKSQHWNFIGRVQSYETLHPIDQSTQFQNQYSRYPQLILNVAYPEQCGGFDYFANNELSHFNFQSNPGQMTKSPMGNRINLQPGISRRFELPYFYFDPRIQFALTKYDLGDVANGEPKMPTRTLPIFDISSGLYFDRSVKLFNVGFTQTLEPQFYYTYVPFRDQSQLPIFDTTLNQLTYDQLFTYNRFSGIDRISDANQIAAGITTRFIDEQSGFEKVRAGIGQIYYFQNRRVTLCSPTTGCLEAGDPNANLRNKSPLSGIIKYNVNPVWGADAASIWNPFTNELDNQTFTVHYQPDANRLINFGYTFVRNGDTYPGGKIDKFSNNLSQIDASIEWPITRDWSSVGKWTQNLNRHNFQNLLIGVQYEGCCWAMRLLVGKEFTQYNQNNTPEYNSEFYLQFVLKGLGNLGPDPTSLLVRNISGYQSTFGRDY